MKRHGNKIQVTLEELRSMKGKSRLAELYQEQQSERLRYKASGMTDAPHKNVK